MRLIFILIAASTLAQTPAPGPQGGSGGGSGVTSIATSCGVTGGTITTTGTISETVATAAHNGSYAILTGDCGKSLTTNTAAAWTIAQAGTTGFETGKFWVVNNVGSGSLTVTATTSTFYGGPTANISGSVLTVPANTSAEIISDGTNYQVLSGSGLPNTVTSASSLVSTECATGAGFQAIQTPSGNCTVDSSGNVTTESLSTGGATPGTSGAVEFAGKTSGQVWIVGADAAGTAIVYVLPSTNGTANQVLSDSGTTTCPTLPGTAPSTCHLLVWITPTITQSTNITVTGSWPNWTIAAAGGSAGICQPSDQTCVQTAPFITSQWNGAVSATVLGWNNSSSDPQGFPGSTVSPVAGEQSPYWSRATSSNVALFYWPPTGSTGGGGCTGAGITDFASGSTPLAWGMWARVSRYFSSGDLYIGINTSCGTLASGFPGFNGVYYKQSTGYWQCFIAGTGTNISALSDNNLHSVFVTNVSGGYVNFAAGNSGTANEIWVQIDSGTVNHCSGTIASGSSNGYFFVVGANGSSTASTGAQSADITTSGMWGAVHGISR